MTTRRPGLTLIELLIAVAIVALLLGLILPAVQQVRASAARAECANNLRQVGLAAQQCNVTRGRLPPAGGPLGAAPAGQVPLVGTAQFFLLNFLDQADAQRVIADEASRRRTTLLYADWPRPQPRIVSSTQSVSDVITYPFARPPQVYLDPADPAVGTGGGVFGLPRGGAVGVTGYAANAQALGHVQYDPRPAKVPDTFKDGVSNTVLFAERSADCQGVHPGWLNVRPGRTAPVFALPDGTSGHPAIRPPQVRPSAADCDPDTVQGPHPGATLVLLADASVRPVGAGVSPAAWLAAVLPADGGRVEIDW